MLGTPPSATYQRPSPPASELRRDWAKASGLRFRSKEPTREGGAKALTASARRAKPSGGPDEEARTRTSMEASKAGAK